MRTARLLLTGVLLSLTVTAVAAPSALAKPEEIAYRCDLDICLADPDNPVAVVNLTDNDSKSLDEHPAWSPDGKRVAFVGTEGGGTQNIFTMTPGLGEASNIATQVTYYSGNLYGNDISELAWSPDGTRLAYARTPNYGNWNGVYVVASDGTTATPATVATEGDHPSWAPDGGKIAYAKGNQIVTNHPDGSNGEQPLPGAGKGEEPSWSPDGSQIAYGVATKNVAYLDLQIVSAPGCGASTVTKALPYPAEYTQWIDAAWSPAGDRVAYRSTHENGSGYYRVTGRYGADDHGLPKVQKVNMGGGIPPSWSPDGLRLTFGGYNFSGGTPANEIFFAKADGSGSVTPIASGTKNHEPDWRPDPLVTPHVPVTCKSVEGPPGSPPGTGGPVGGNSPGGQRPAKRIWFTKRRPITASAPIHVLIVACGAPKCGVVTEGTARSVAPPSTGFRPAEISKKNPKKVVVGTGKLNLLEGQSKTLFMHLNKAGKALFKQQGKLDIEATVKIVSPGQPVDTSKKTIHVVLKKPKKKR